MKYNSYSRFCSQSPLCALYYIALLNLRKPGPGCLFNKCVTYADLFTTKNNPYNCPRIKDATTIG